MKTSSYTLIPSTTYGTAVENYVPAYPPAPDSFSGIPAKAAAYYSKDKSVQTVSWYMTMVLGVITIEATLDSDPDTANWHSIVAFGDGIIPIDGNAFVNLEGNYTWIRATMTEFTAGTIQKVSVGY